jgi:LPS-assembly protein
MRFGLRIYLGWTLLIGATGIGHAGEALPPLRVDPALLGAAPAAPTAPPAAPPAAPSAVAPTPVAVPTTAARKEIAPGAPAQPAKPVAAASASVPGTTYVWADELRGRNDIETVAEGNVELHRDADIMTAERLTYRHAEDETEANGKVRLTRGDDVFAGPYARLRGHDNTGYVDQPEYSITRTPKPLGPLEPPRPPQTGSGHASRIDMEGKGLYRLKAATFSTCQPARPDWYIEADEIRLDYNTNDGEASSGKVYFKDTPILYAPWLSFSLNNERKSGLLAPTFGHSTTSGTEFTLPYYWNIAPNMDATIAPRLMMRRGLQLNSELRYIDYAYNGQARFEYLPGDRLAQRDRSAYAILHNQALTPNLTANLNFNGVSDYAYFSDLSTRVATVSQANLLRQGSVTYGAGWWNATLMAQRFQTLQDPAAPVAVPYYRLPQLTLAAVRPDLPAGLVGSFAGEYVRFSHPTQLTGQRAILYPQLSLPWQTAAFFVTPKLGLHYTRYALDARLGDGRDQLTRQVPIFSVDSGVVFERGVDWFGRSLTQTLEPRLYYLNVPVRDQSQIPVFDSALVDFNFAQIFSENRYGGGDRIGDANQLTAAAVSRLIDPDTGVELMRGALGQRFYFRDQQVTLPGEEARTSRKTDLLAAFSGRVAPKVFVDTGWQYNPNFSRTERLNVGARYQPEFGKVFNASYRYTRDQVGQIDLSGQWPIGGGWQGVARYNYSLKDRSAIENLVGLEYDAGCWTARVALHRLATLTAKASTTFFVQLELNGLARIGSNPLEMLKRNVPGYGIISQPTADPVFGAY